MFQWSLGFLIEFWSDRFEVIFLFDLCNCNCFFYRSVTAHLNYSILLLPKIFQHVLVYYWVWSWWGFFFVYHALFILLSSCIWLNNCAIPLFTLMSLYLMLHSCSWTVHINRRHCWLIFFSHFLLMKHIVCLNLLYSAAVNIERN